MNEISQKKSGIGKKIGLVVFLLMVVAVIVALINREWIYDWYRGVSYQPSNEMATIRSKLQLTGRGEFLFNATQPELDEATDFNKHCRQDEDEVAVLGCYTEGNIYVYNITEDELDGIRELTTAHELLHAVWARMSEGERLEFVSALTRVFEENQDLLGPEIDTYDTSEKQEELYVRAGTEVKDLPEILEKHFAEVFKDQDKIVDFYESYIAVFRAIKAEMDQLLNDIEILKEQIDLKMAEYEGLYNQLEADIVSFNSCAEVVGCFASEAEFNLRRLELIGRQNGLNALYEEINGLINEYNTKIDLYNADVTESHKLQDMINSNSKTESIR